MSWADFAVKARHGLDIVIENFDSGFDDGFERLKIAFEVGNQQFYADFRIKSLDPENRLGEMRRAAVGKIVTIDRSDDDMIRPRSLTTSATLRGSSGSSASGLPLSMAQKRQPRVQVSPRIKKRRRLVAPALADVRAARFFANRVKIFLAHETFQAQVVGIARRFDFDPVGMSSAAY